MLRVRCGPGTAPWRGAPHGLGPAAFALLETTGRRTGPLGHTVVGNGLAGETFWVVAAHGWQSDCLRNLAVEPRVGVLVEGAGHGGMVSVMADDDPVARSRTLRHRWAAIGRALATTRP